MERLRTIRVVGFGQHSGANLNPLATGVALQIRQPNNFAQSGVGVDEIPRTGFRHDEGTLAAFLQDNQVA